MKHFCLCAFFVYVFFEGLFCNRDIVNAVRVKNFCGKIIAPFRIDDSREFLNIEF